MNQSIIEVSFKVYAPVGHGEEVRICGNVPALGCNNPIRSIPLITTSSDYPIWYTKEGLFLPGGQNEVAYKYCVFSGGKFSRWEDSSEDFIRSLRFSDNQQNFSRRVSDSLGLLNSGFNIKSNILPKPSDHHLYQARHFEEWSNRALLDANVPSNYGVIIVSFFLPVVLKRLNNGSWTAEWDYENVVTLNLKNRTTWIGSVRYDNSPIPENEEEAVAAALAPLNCFPIFLSQLSHEKFYDNFCKKYLWPAMHHIADVYGPLELSKFGAGHLQDEWFNYATVLSMFKNKVIEVYHTGDVIWIHGFHLMVLPSLLRRSQHSAKIGYFFHTPFPSSEIWRTIVRREDLLRGVLSADHVGFHLFEYARHFMTSCHRLLGYTTGMNSSGNMTVDVDGREVAVSCIHVGVDYDRVDNFCSQVAFSNRSKEWRSRFKNKIVISGIDRLERLKGIPLKLFAIDEFMATHPEYKGKLLFAIIGISARERGSDYRQTVFDVKNLVNIINQKYATPEDPLIFFEERKENDMQLMERLSFFAASDVLMITAARDGLNRMPMEFILAKNNSNQQGQIIISEFISSARVMQGALVVNPWKVEELTNALVFALEMPSFEASKRFSRNLEMSRKLNITDWANQVLSDIMSVSNSVIDHSDQAFGFGTAYRLLRIRTEFGELDTKQLIQAYRVCENRLFLLDWGGTLVVEHLKSDKLQAYSLAQGHTSRTGPTQEMKDILSELCQDRRNIVFVVSGKEVKVVSEVFGDVRDLGLAAEHGAYYRWPRKEVSSSFDKSNSVKWKSMLPLGDQSWKDAASTIMDIYVRRTHGTYIERKGNALIWQFRDADPEFGFLQSKELEEHLTEILSGYDVEVLRGGGVADGYIEVRPAGLSKGTFLTHVVDMMKSLNKSPTFILAIGDDSSDEPMFEEINKIRNDDERLMAFGVTVGMKPSSAQSYVDDPQAVMEVLRVLSRHTSSSRRSHFSTYDLSSQNSGDMPLNVSMPSRSLSSGNLAAAAATSSIKQSTSRSKLTVSNSSLGHMSMSQYKEGLNDDQEEGIFI